MEVAEWWIHVGAHKTATTHLQYSMALQRDRIAAQGKDYIPLDKVREADLVKILRRKGWRKFLPSSVFRNKWFDAIEPLRCGPSTVIISEENFLGGSKDLLRPDFYPEAETRMAVLRDIVGTERLRLF